MNKVDVTDYPTYSNMFNDMVRESHRFKNPAIMIHYRMLDLWDFEFFCSFELDEQYGEIKVKEDEEGYPKPELINSEFNTFIKCSKETSPFYLYSKYLEQLPFSFITEERRTKVYLNAYINKNSILPKNIWFIIEKEVYDSITESIYLEIENNTNKKNIDEDNILKAVFEVFLSRALGQVYPSLSIYKLKENVDLKKLAEASKKSVFHRFNIKG